MNNPAILHAVVYGDLETVTTYQESVTTRSVQLNLDIIGWHHDPEGLSGIDQLGDAPGLVAALGKCVRTHAALYVPFPQDTPSEQHRRLIAHWLHDRGLRFFVGGVEHHWDVSFDGLERALRQMLEAARSLDIAIAASGAVPVLEDLLTELLGGSGAPESTATAVCSTERQQICIDAIRDMADEIYELHEAAAELLKCTESCVVPDDYQRALSILDMARDEVAALSALVQIHFSAPGTVSSSSSSSGWDSAADLGVSPENVRRPGAHQ